MGGQADVTAVPKLPPTPTHLWVRGKGPYCLGAGVAGGRLLKAEAGPLSGVDHPGSETLNTLNSGQRLCPPHLPMTQWPAGCAPLPANDPARASCLPAGGGARPSSLPHACHPRARHPPAPATPPRPSPPRLHPLLRRASLSPMSPPPHSDPAWEGHAAGWRQEAQGARGARSAEQAPQSPCHAVRPCRRVTKSVFPLLAPREAPRVRGPRWKSCPACVLRPCSRPRGNGRAQPSAADPGYAVGVMAQLPRTYPASPLPATPTPKHVCTSPASAPQPWD